MFRSSSNINPDADTRFMRMALSRAINAFRMGEIPVGAVIVSSTGRILGQAHNMTETLNDVTAHAEIQAITAASLSLGGKYLKDCTLYVTLEPCLMCAGAIAWSQLSRIVIGASDPKRGYSTLTTKMPFHPSASITTGVCEAECAQLMKDFFNQRR